MLTMEKDLKMKDYRKLFNDLKKGHYFGRLGKTFKTDDYYYFYDTGTGKIARLKENVYAVIECLLENNDFDSLAKLNIQETDILSALEEITLAIDHEHILSAPILETMVGDAVSDLENSLSNSMNGITLELTEACNLRCKYCIYHHDHPSFREFGHSHMSFETAKNAINFLNERISKNDEVVYVGFYGGEPLLNFNVMKDTMEYAKTIIKNKELKFTMTTNAVLLSSDICKYLLENDVIVTFSLDGPRELHDENRLYINGKGSFDDTIRGIEKYLSIAKNLDIAPNFTINMVMTGPNYEEKYDKVQNFLESCDWYTKTTVLRSDLADSGPESIKYMLPGSLEEKEFLSDRSEITGRWSDTRSESYTKIDDLFTYGSIVQELLRIHKRQLSVKPVKFYSMNGCCVPGQRRTFITVKGDILPCERVGTNVTPLGNIYSGFDMKKTTKVYVTDYINDSVKTCKNCWAVNLCGVCYVGCYDENGLNVEHKNSVCIFERFRIENSLIRYHKIFEKSPNKLDSLNDVTLH